MDRAHLLLAIVSLIAGASCQDILTTVFTNGSCFDGFLPHVDTIFFESYIYTANVEAKDFTNIAEVFIGSKRQPLGRRHCRINIKHGSCNPGNQPKDGCWCQDLPVSLTRYLVRGNIPARDSLSGRVVTVRWVAHDHRLHHLGTSDEIKIYDRPYVYVIVNGDVFNITKNKCPSLPLTANTLLYFCVEKVEDPHLTIWFDSQNHCTFDARCGFMSMKFDRSYGNKEFWIAHVDSCARTSNMTCQIPPDCCGASSLQVMKAMLAVVALGHLLKMN